jgi:DNA-binding NarL/FixJ family response regulator
MKILLADDHPLFREGVKPVLYKLEGDTEVIEAKDYPCAFQAAHDNLDLDLALLDLYMPGMRGKDGVSRFRAAFPELPVVVLSASEQSEDIHRLMAAGALGYITKSSPSEVILSALRLVLSGGVYLPPSLLWPAEAGGDQGRAFPARPPALTLRQLEVLRELVQGKSNRQIAESLNVTEGTIKIHMAGIFRTLKVANRTEAVLIAQKMGLGGSHAAPNDHVP